MGSNLTIEADQFGAALSEILGEIEPSITRALPVASKKAGKFGVKKVRENAVAAEIGGTGRYIKSWGCKTGRKSNGCEVEIGSKMPGLPHLLEKGHATLGGGYVPGRMHIATAATSTFNEFQKEVEKMVEDSLDGD